MVEAFFSAATHPLYLLVQNIEAGEIALSGIQRPFVWPNARVRDLFDSMYRGYPVGYLLFAPYDGWRAGSSRRGPTQLIVDGQQRLTSLYSVMKGTPVMREDFREERIVIAFRPRDGRFEVGDAAVRSDPEFVSDIGPLVSGKVPQYRFVKEYLEKLRAHRPVNDEEETRISTAIYRLYDLQSYPFTVLQLSRALDEEQIAEVFVRINSRGVPLTMADFVLTLMAVSWEDGRRALEEFCRRTRETPVTGEESPANAVLQPTPDQMLRVAAGLAFRRVRLGQTYSILQGRDPETGEPSEGLRDERFRLLQEAQQFALDPRNWRDFLGTVEAAGYRNAEMVTSPMALLHCYTIYLIGRKERSLEGPVLKAAMARWVFFVMMTGRYSGASERIVEDDLARLGDATGRNGYLAALEALASAGLSPEFWARELPADLATTSSRSAAALAYYAALNVLSPAVLPRAKDSGHFPGRGSGLERRPVFPRKELERAGKGLEREAAQAANVILATPQQGKWASARDLRTMLAREFEPEQLAEAERLHALPAGWADMEYEAFLTARRRAMASVVKEALDRLGSARPRSEGRARLQVSS